MKRWSIPEPTSIVAAVSVSATVIVPARMTPASIWRMARTAAETDWLRIAALYDALAQLTPSPIVDLNRAVAVGMAFGPAAGLELVDALGAEPSLKSYHLLPAVRGVVIAGRDVSARSDDGAAAVPVVLAELQRAGVNAASVAVARPSLDDVYLRHTGRRYSESQHPDRDGHTNELETAGVSK